MVVSRKKFISGSILLIVLVLIIFYIFNDIDMNGKSFLTIVGFSIIGILSILSIIKDARVISTNKFFWYFQFVFINIAHTIAGKAVRSFLTIKLIVEFSISNIFSLLKKRL